MSQEQPPPPVDPVSTAGSVDPMSTAGDIPAERALLARAIGGWRGMIDSSVPSVVFLLAYIGLGYASDPALAERRLTVAIWAAVAAGVVIAVLRLVRRESLQQVVAGFAGVAVSAWVTARTGQAEDYYLPGLLINAAYGGALLVSVLVGWPLIGVAIGLITGDGTQWRSVPTLRRAYAAATWLWVGVFAVRLVVQVPLYLAGAVGPLGVARLIMGWPLFLLAAYLTYRVLAPVLARHREGQQASTPDQ